MSTEVLSAFLGPLRPFLSDPQVEEALINRPGEVFVERAGDMVRHEVDDLSRKRLIDLAGLIATYTNQVISEEKPLLSAQLPEGYRVQVVIPPACHPEQFGLSIRKPMGRKFSLDEYEAAGSFDPAWRRDQHSQSDYGLGELYRTGKIKEFLARAVIARKNIVVSGGTASGKTTFLKALIELIPAHERILTIEDVQELDVPHINKLHLLASAGGQGKAKVDFYALIMACLRLRPDRIIVGELRGGPGINAFFDSLNTGHEGSVSSVHANSTDECFERLTDMVMDTERGQTMSWDQIHGMVRKRIDVVVQFARLENKRRVMTGIYYREADHAG
jgi:type IV secretion system protein VirB11